ncbi:MAG: hypothetical protein M8357_16765 [Desulfobulbaceae bacterium]|nr:hypothetical protein [Desulfobulbaceae bacterium]
MKEIITLFAGKYGLTKPEVMAEIETVFSVTLSRWYGMEVLAHFRENLQLEAVAYNDSGGIIRQQQIDLTETRGRNILLRQLEENLAKAVVFKQTVRYKSFERELLWGEITACDAEHNLYVETEITPGERVTAYCPLNRIGVHERHSGKFSIGSKRAFHLRRVEPVLLNGTPRLKVMVDRVSKTMVEKLLKSQLGPRCEKIQIRCLKRYVGHKSIVLATKRLPKAAIIAVDRELKERVQVKIVKSLPAG